MKISLIIPAYNEEKYIGDCLDHALKNSHGKFHEIIVIDNASTDKTKEVVQKYPGVRVVTETQKGLVKARQRGYLEATGDILAYNDADTHMPEGWVDKVLGIFSNDTQEKISVVSGPYYYYDLTKVDKFWVYMYWWFLGIPTYWITGYMVIGGNFAIRKSVIDKMGGFDTSIEFYGEDTDIARRASKFGKSKFMLSLMMPTSARRLKDHGTWKTAGIYVLNYASEVLFKKPFTKDYKDIR